MGLTKNRKNQKNSRKKGKKNEKEREKQHKKQFKFFLRVEFSLAYKLNCIVHWDTIDFLCNRNYVFYYRVYI